MLYNVIYIYINNNKSELKINTINNTVTSIIIDLNYK